jgi:RNA polymerase sigma-70 factor (ECF subfamily)
MGMKAHPDSGHTDDALIAAILHEGDERAFRRLYRRYTPRLYLFVLRILGGAEHDAEDVVQETWIRVGRALAGFRGEAAFSTWLQGIGLNVARNLLRRRDRLRWVDWEDLPDPPLPPDATDERIDLERAVALLPDGCRLVLVLHDIEGLKHREIAARLEVTEGTSKSQLFHARRLLRGILRPAEEWSHGRPRLDVS